jgi:lipoprotein-anchoring transpeptidase ErfK/SrfK
VHTRVYIAARWLLYLHGTEVVAAWSIGVGKPGEETPTGEFTIGPKQKDPVWFRPGHDPVPFGDPENPLGTRWLPWHAGGEKTGFGFHGTNEPEAVGGRVSQGCVRMRNEDVELLHAILPEGARVVVRP